jgi:hypothetical protein
MHGVRFDVASRQLEEVRNQMLDLYEQKKIIGSIHFKRHQPPQVHGPNTNSLNANAASDTMRGHVMTVY